MITRRLSLRDGDTMHSITVKACNLSGNVRVSMSSDSSLIGADPVALSKWTQQENKALYHAGQWVSVSSADIIGILFNE